MKLEVIVVRFCMSRRPSYWLILLSAGFMFSQPHSNWLFCEAVNHSDVPTCSFPGKVVLKMQCLSSVPSSRVYSVSAL